MSSPSLSGGTFMTPNKYLPAGVTSPYQLEVTTQPPPHVTAAEVMFRGRYAALKRIYEERLASLAQSFTKIGQELVDDEVVRTLSQDVASSAYLPDRVEEMISAQLTAERTSVINDLSCRLAETEAALDAAQRDLTAVVADRENFAHRAAANVSKGLSRDIIDLKAEYKAALDASLAEQSKLRDQLATARQETAGLRAQHDVNVEQLAQLKTEVVQLKGAENRANKADNELQRATMQLAEEKNYTARLTSDLQEAQRKEKETTEKNQQLQFTVQHMKVAVDAAEEKRVNAVHSAQEAELRFKAAHERMEHLMASEVDESGHALVEIKLRAEAARERLAEEIRRQKKKSREGEKELQKLRSELLEMQRLRDIELDNSKGRVREVEAMMSLRLQQLEEQLVDAKKEAERSQLLATARSKNLQERQDFLGMSPLGPVSPTGPVTPSIPARPGLVPGRSHASSHRELSQKLLADKLDEATTNIAQLKSLLKEEARKAVIAEQKAHKALQESEMLRAQMDGAADTEGEAQRRLAAADKIIARAEQRIGAAEGRAAAAEEELQRVHAVSHAGRLELDRLREVSMKLEAMGEQSIRELNQRDEKVAKLQAIVTRYEQEQQLMEEQIQILEQQQQLAQADRSRHRALSARHDNGYGSSNESAARNRGENKGRVGSLIIRRAMASQVQCGLIGMKEELQGLSGDIKAGQKDLQDVCQGALRYLTRIQRSQLERRQRSEEQQRKRREEQQEQQMELQAQYGLVKELCLGLLQEVGVQTPLSGLLQGVGASYDVTQELRVKVREAVIHLQQGVEKAKRELEMEVTHSSKLEKMIKELEEANEKRQIERGSLASTLDGDVAIDSREAPNRVSSRWVAEPAACDGVERDRPEASGYGSDVAGSVSSNGPGGMTFALGLDGITRRASALRREEDWERNKTEFAMLVELQKLQSDSDMKELQSQLQEANRSAEVAVREVNSRVAASLAEAANQAEEDMNRLKEEHEAMVTGLEARLKAETIKYRELQERAGRESRLHAQELSDAERKLVEAQQELQRAKDEIDELQFTLQTERQQLKRLEKRLREIDEARSRVNSMPAGAGGSSHSSPVVNRLLTPRMSRMLNSPLPPSTPARRTANSGGGGGGSQGLTGSTHHSNTGGQTVAQGEAESVNTSATANAHLSSSTRSNSQFRSSFSTAASTPVGPRQKGALSTSYAPERSRTGGSGGAGSGTESDSGEGHQNGQKHHHHGQRRQHVHRHSIDYATQVVEEARRKLSDIKGLTVSTNNAPLLAARRRETESRDDGEKRDKGNLMTATRRSAGGDGNGGRTDSFYSLGAGYRESVDDIDDGIASWSSEGVADLGNGGGRDDGRSASVVATTADEDEEIDGQIDSVDEGPEGARRGRGTDILSPPLIHPPSYRLSS